MMLRAEDLLDAGQAPIQISLDQTREARLLAETAADRASQRFGKGSVVPAATLLGKAS